MAEKTKEIPAAKVVRRLYTPEFRAGAVALVVTEKRPPGQVARELGISRSAIEKWIRQARVDEGLGKGGSLTTEEQQELSRLRKENRQLQMERDILKKASAFFAKEMMP